MKPKTAVYSDVTYVSLAQIYKIDKQSRYAKEDLMFIKRVNCIFMYGKVKAGNLFKYWNVNITRAASDILNHHLRVRWFLDV